MELADRLLRAALDPEVEARRELHRAHHAHGVLAEADHRVADRADDALLQVVHAPDPVDHRERLDVVEEPVHREVAPVGVRLRRAERVVLERTLRRVLDDLADRLGVLAERRRLDDLLAEADMSQAETPPHEEAVAERPLHLVRRRARADVEVLRVPPQQQVAHAAPHEVRGVAEPRKAVQHLQGIRVDVLPRDAMRRALVDHGRVLL